MRAFFASASVVLVAVSAVACSSSSSAPATQGSAGSSSTYPQFGEDQWSKYENGVGVPETQACMIYESALSSAANAHGCPYTESACPDFIRDSEVDETTDKKYACAQFDDGVLQACVAFLEGLSCDALPYSGCKLKTIDRTAIPIEQAANGCPGSGGAGGSGGSGGSAGESGAGGAAGSGGYAGGASGSAGNGGTGG